MLEIYLKCGPRFKEPTSLGNKQNPWYKGLCLIVPCQYPLLSSAVWYYAVWVDGKWVRVEPPDSL